MMTLSCQFEEMTEKFMWQNRVENIYWFLVLFLTIFRKQNLFFVFLIGSNPSTKANQ
jgi:hypothetical protein